MRREVRAFLARELPAPPIEQRVNSWSVFDADFSQKLGAAGWIGMIWPTRYGGHERDSIERYVVLEELLAAGAPVGAHWIADRQSGPALLRFGSELQREKYLAGMARGEIYCCIGMSEPNAGSDLASVRTRAEKLDDGRWKINGQKVWTTNAHRKSIDDCLGADIARGRIEAPRWVNPIAHRTRYPGISVRPITDLVGDTHFNEVFFEDAIVPADCLLGEEGNGWSQVTSELSLERSGPERYLSSLALYLAWIDSMQKNHLGSRRRAGRWEGRRQSYLPCARCHCRSRASWQPAVIRGGGIDRERLRQ